MTTAPAWLPTWASSFPDLGSIYRRTVARQFPEGLYDDDEPTDEALDVRSMADALGFVAQAAHWIRAELLPQNDTNELFMSLWESCLGIASEAVKATRSAAITAAWRIRWTMTKAATQAVFSVLYGVDPSTIEFTVPTIAQINAAATGATDPAHRKIFEMLITCTAQTPPLSWLAADAETRKRAPAWEQWTAGETKLFTWDDPTATWDRSVWS